MMTQFGVQIPPQDCTLDELVTMSQRAERLGYSWVSVSDHITATLGRETVLEVSSWDAVVALAAIAANTQSVRCGLLVSTPTIRHPVTLLKAMVTLDYLSRGRVECGLGMGWLSFEHSMFGIPFPSADVRFAMLEEAVEVMTTLMSGESNSPSSGSFFRLEHPLFVPNATSGHVPPLWVGGTSQRVMELAAAKGLGWNSIILSIDKYRKINSRFAELCASHGRETSSAPVSGIVIALPDDPEIQRVYSIWRGISEKEAIDQFVTGPDVLVIERLRSLIELGLDYLILLVKAPDAEGVTEWFATQIAPFLR